MGSLIPPGDVSPRHAVADWRLFNALIAVKDAANELRVATEQLIAAQAAQYSHSDPDAGNQSRPALTPAGSPGDAFTIAGAGGGGFSTLFALSPPASRILDLSPYSFLGRHLTAGGFTLPAVRSGETTRWATAFAKAIEERGVFPPRPIDLEHCTCRIGGNVLRFSDDCQIHGGKAA